MTNNNSNTEGRQEGYYRVKYKGTWGIADYTPYIINPWRFYDQFLKESDFDEIDAVPINPTPSPSNQGSGQSIKEWKEGELQESYDRMKKDMDRLAELEIEVVHLRKYHTAALKLAASNAKELWGQSYPRWVKASERKPNNNIQVFCKHSKGRKDVWNFGNGLPIPEWIEYWLEEPPSSI